jgi:hypothetical protein
MSNAPAIVTCPGIFPVRHTRAGIEATIWIPVETMIRAIWYGEHESQEKVCHEYRSRASISRFETVYFDDLVIGNINAILRIIDKTHVLPPQIRV